MALPRHKSPVARVLAVIAVVAQHKVLSGGHSQFAVVGEALHLPPPFRIDIGIGVNLCGKVVAEVGSGGAGSKDGVGLVEATSVHEHLAIHDAQPVAGKPTTRLTSSGGSG